MAQGTTFIIFNTAGQPISAIQPNTLDGPDGVQQNSDLRMYGLGYPNWGEGVDENDYHLVENFACPPLSNYPLSARYLLLGPTVAALTPAGQAVDELGAGNGINVPLVGQLWYNTVQNKLFVNTSPNPNPAWTSVGTQAVAIGPMPLTPTLGDLWYDASIPQLKIYNGTSFVSVAALYLPLTGGTLTGTLNMSSATINMGGNKIVSLATGTNSADAVNLAQMNAAISGSGLFVPVAGGTMTGALNMSSAAINTNSAINLSSTGSINLTTGSITWSGSPVVAINTNGGRITHVGNAVATTDALTAQFADGRYVNNVDSNPKTVSAPITFTSAAPPVAGAAPTIGSHLTNKTYVDSLITANVISSVVAANGRIVYPGGLIMQWGSINTGILSGENSVPFGPYSFAFAFPHNCFNVQLTGNGGSPLGVTNITTTTFSIFTGYTGGHNTTVVYYFAVGN